MPHCWKSHATAHVVVRNVLYIKLSSLVASDMTIGTRDVFYVRRKVDLMKKAKVNAYIMHIFGKIELLSTHAT